MKNKSIFALILITLSVIFLTYEKQETDNICESFSLDDRVTLLTLLNEKRYTELENWFSTCDEILESDISVELFLDAAFRVFSSVPEESAKNLDEWISKYPTSSIAWLARGQYRHNRGADARGNKRALKTASTKFKAMTEWYKLSRQDIKESLELNPKQSRGYALLLSIAASKSPDQERQYILDEALEHIPYTYTVRSTFLFYLQPQWSGPEASWDGMREYARNSLLHLDHNPLLARLESEVESLYGMHLMRRKKYFDALVAHNRAVEIQPYPGAFNDRAKTYVRVREYEKALGDINESLRIYPAQFGTRLSRASTLRLLKRRKEGLEELKYLEGYFPNNDELYNELGTAYWGLERHEEAAEAYTVAIDNNAHGDFLTAKLYFNRGLLNRMDLLRIPEAILDLETSFAFDPKPIAWVELMGIRYDQKSEDTPLMAAQLLALCEVDKKCKQDWIDWADGFLTCLEKQSGCNWAKKNYEYWEKLISQGSLELPLRHQL
jgi:tetratricopeptide (TPR) repeat protein